MNGETFHPITKHVRCETCGLFHSGTALDDFTAFSIAVHLRQICRDKHAVPTPLADSIQARADALEAGR